MGVEDRRAALARGARAEAFVADCLEQEGWTVLDRNWRGRGGELDLVVGRDGAVRFVEVKARALEDPSGLESISYAKRTRMVRAAEAWMLEQPEDPREVCFLIAVVDLDPTGWSVEWFDDAFDGR
ncbi:MAG: YraN family protein [Deltaproteobacteria bacterium]|nr:YraN family protein [Deltaproteobacteria bacterium]